MRGRVTLELGLKSAGLTAETTAPSALELGTWSILGRLQAGNEREHSDDVKQQVGCVAALVSGLPQGLLEEFRGVEEEIG